MTPRKVMQSDQLHGIYREIGLFGQGLPCLIHRRPISDLKGVVNRQKHRFSIYNVTEASFLHPCALEESRNQRCECMRFSSL